MSKIKLSYFFRLHSEIPPLDYKVNTDREGESRMNLWIEHWGESKFFALYDGNDLVGVFVYRRGAEHVKQLLEGLENRIEALEKLLIHS